MFILNIKFHGEVPSSSTNTSNSFLWDVVYKLQKQTNKQKPWKISDLKNVSWSICLKYRVLRDQVARGRYTTAKRSPYFSI